MSAVPDRNYPVKQIVVKDKWTPPKGSPEYTVKREEIEFKRYLAALSAKRENERNGWK